MYDNQKEIDKINDAIKTIDESFELTRFSMRGNKAISVGITIHEKGNKQKAEALKKMGFEIIHRSKTPEPWGSGYASGRYKGYAFILTMEKRLLGKESD